MHEVTDASFEEDVLRADHPVVVDFWAPWCGPCHAVTKTLERISEDHAGFEFVKLDIDENPVTASRYDVLSIPTVIVFAAGVPREVVVGARSADHFREVLSREVLSREGLGREGLGREGLGRDVPGRLD